MPRLTNQIFTPGILGIRTLTGIAFACFAVFSILVFLFAYLNIFNIEPLMYELCQESRPSSISDLIKALKQRYETPSDIQLLGSVYFDRYPYAYFEESHEKNIFRLLNIALQWGLRNSRDYYLDEMIKLAEDSSNPLLRYRIYLHIAVYYSHSAEKYGNSLHMSLYKDYLDRADRIYLEEKLKVDLDYNYAYYYFLEKKYDRSLRYLNRALRDELFIDARLLQLILYISIDKNEYFYRMEAYKLTNSIISNPEIEEMMIVIILRILAEQSEKNPGNPFFYYFMAIYYNKLNDTEKALENALRFGNTYKKPVYDYFIEDNKIRIRNLEKLRGTSNDRL